MCRRRKYTFFLSWFMLCCALNSAAQHELADSTLYNVADTPVAPEEEATSQSESESAPERTIIYNSAGPNAAQWQQATDSEAYGYRDKREYIKKPEPPPQETPGWIKALGNFIEWLSSSAGKTFLWIALALIVGYVAYRIIAGQSSGLFSRGDRKESLPEEHTGNISEQGLLESDWEERLRIALAAGDTRLAIRYSYMRLLQMLQEKSLIVYRPDKTNNAYYRELTESMRQPFRTILRQYEYAWYGNLLPEPAAMERYMQTYEGLKKSITYA